MTDTLDALQSALEYRFKDRALLEQAVTHKSFAHENREETNGDNERLEFLGDSILGLVVSTLLWEQFPKAPEGELTRRRADLVCEASLSVVATEIGVGAAMRLGRGETRTGGRDKPRLLASSFEACVGAIYLDGGLDAAIVVVRRLFGERMRVASPGAADFKSRLQELVQQNKSGASPVYEITNTEGPDHDRRFFVAVRVAEQVLGEGSGRSKGEAEQAAAQQALTTLTTNGASAD